MYFFLLFVVFFFFLNRNIMNPICSNGFKFVYIKKIELFLEKINVLLFLSIKKLIKERRLIPSDLNFHFI